jgi:hypothetical protein
MGKVTDAEAAFGRIDLARKKNRERYRTAYVAVSFVACD